MIIRHGIFYAALDAEAFRSTTEGGSVMAIPRRKVLKTRSVAKSRKIAAPARIGRVRPGASVAADCNQRCPQDCDSGSLERIRAVRSPRAARSKARIRARAKVRGR